MRYLHIVGNMEKEIAISALAALAQETRLDVFRLLVQAGPGACPPGPWQTRSTSLRERSPSI